MFDAFYSELVNFFSTVLYTLGYSIVGSNAHIFATIVLWCFAPLLIVPPFVVLFKLIDFVCGGFIK